MSINPSNSPTKANSELIVRVSLSGISKMNPSTKTTAAKKHATRTTPKVAKPSPTGTNLRRRVHGPSTTTQTRGKPKPLASLIPTKEQLGNTEKKQGKTTALKKKTSVSRQTTKVIVKNRTNDNSNSTKKTSKAPNAKAKKFESKFENALLFKLNARNTNQSRDKDNSIWLLRAGYKKKGNYAKTTRFVQDDFL